MKNDTPSSLFMPMFMSAGQNLKFSHLTVEDGLAHNVTNNVLQDPQGFIWIASFDGLNRFDGYDVKVFRHDPDGANGLGASSLSTNHVRAATIDPAGLIWLATAGGLNKFDPLTETFTHYQHQPDNPNSLGFDFAVSLCIDRAGLIWIGGLGALDQFNPETETFVHYRHDPDDPTTIGPGQVHSIREDRDGTLWIGNRGGGGLSRFDRDSQRFVRYCHDPEDPHSLSDDSVHVVYIDRAGELWVGTENGGLNHFDRATETFRRYQRDAHDSNSLSNDFIRDILQDQAGHFWIATVGGLNKMDRASRTFIHYLHNPADPASISSDDTSRIFQDRTGGLWLTTFQGVNYCSPKYQQFRQYRHEPDNPNSLDDSSVRALYEDASGNLWVGTGKGLNKLDRTRQRVTHYQHDPGDPASLSPGAYVNVVLEDVDHKLWVGVWGGELNYFDPQTEQFWRPSDDPANPQIRDVSAICEDQNRDIWVGAYNQRLYRFDRARQRFIHYPHDPDDPHSLSANTVSAIYRDRADTLWVGTETAGLNRFDRTTEIFVHYRHNPQDPTSLSSDWIRCIYADQAGNLWIGTLNGLNRFDRKTETFKRYVETDGRPIGMVHGILEDKASSSGEAFSDEEASPDRERGHLWLSTNKGLLRFNPRTETFQSYGAADGAQNAFDGVACCKSRSEEMFFGGLNGVTAFYPEQIIHNDNIPPVVITNFLLFNKPVSIGGGSPLQQAIWATREITLSDQDYSFAFEFAALNYVAAEKNRYKYRLEGFDQDWIEVDARRRYVAYTNLPAGEYVFRVIGSNNHGVWNEQGAAVKISVVQPWWEKLRLEKEAAEAANRAKSQFLANMSHELRTPLNAILGFSQLMQRDPGLSAEQRENLGTIVRSGEYLLALINDVLNLAKIEAGRVELQAENFDLYRMLLGLEEMFRLRAEQKGLTLAFDRAPDVPQYVRADRGKLRQVLINLLGNAVKFTEEGGVTLRVSGRRQAVDSRRGKDGDHPFLPSTVYCLLFEVEDTGPGIAPAEQDDIFEAFVQTESGQQSQEGTGLGLPISRQYVQMMGGEISVSSEVGRGTTFRFDVQVNQVDASAVLAAEPDRRVIGLEPGQPVYRLLVVDDKISNRKLLVNMLKPLGFDIKETRNGLEAIDSLEGWYPHLIWMDMRMPVMDGYEATRRIKSKIETVIIAVTASAFEEDRAAVLEAGCDDFVRKPFQETEIFDKMARHLGVRYIYAEEAPAEAAQREAHKPLAPADLAALPEEWLVALQDAVEETNPGAANAIIHQIREQDEPLADALAGLVRAYRFDTLQALFEETEV